MYVWIHDKYSSTSFKQRLSGLWQTEIWFWYNKANFSNHVCHCGAVVKELLVRADKPRLQNSPYFYVFKHARAVKQKVCNEAENRERDWGESLFFSPFFLSPHTPVRACEARALRAHKTLTLRFTVFFTDFEKKNRLSLQSKINRVRLPCCCFLFLCTVFFSVWSLFLNTIFPFGLFSFILTADPADHAQWSIYILRLSPEFYFGKGISRRLLICMLAKLTVRKKHKLPRLVPPLKQLNFFNVSWNHDKQHTVHHKLY